MTKMKCKYCGKINADSDTCALKNEGHHARPVVNDAIIQPSEGLPSEEEMRGRAKFIESPERQDANYRGQLFMRYKAEIIISEKDKQIEELKAELTKERDYNHMEENHLGNAINAWSDKCRSLQSQQPVRLTEDERLDRFMILKGKKLRSEGLDWDEILEYVSARYISFESMKRIARENSNAKMSTEQNYFDGLHKMRELLSVSADREQGSELHKKAISRITPEQREQITKQLYPNDKEQKCKVDPVKFAEWKDKYFVIGFNGEYQQYYLKSDYFYLYPDFAETNAHLKDMLALYIQSNKQKTNESRQRSSGV